MTFAATCEEIIADLNRIFDRRFKADTGLTMALIRKRMGEGFTVRDFKVVHRYVSRHRGWRESRRKAYIRPKTLYNDSYFERFLKVARLTHEKRRRD